MDAEEGLEGASAVKEVEIRRVWARQGHLERRAKHRETLRGMGWWRGEEEAAGFPAPTMADEKLYWGCMRGGQARCRWIPPKAPSRW